MILIKMGENNYLNLEQQIRIYMIMTFYFFIFLLFIYVLRGIFIMPIINAYIRIRKALGLPTNLQIHDSINISK